MQKLFSTSLTPWTQRFVMSPQMSSESEDSVEISSAKMADMFLRAGVVSSHMAEKGGP